LFKEVSGTERFFICRSFMIGITGSSPLETNHAMSHTVILSVGSDEVLLSSRNAVLRKAGYVVVAVSSPEQAMLEFDAGDFDLVLLCHSIPSGPRERLADAMHARSPGTPVLCVGGLSLHDGASSLSAVESDPKQLLASVREVAFQAMQSRRNVAS
jgi:DNA-binding NtrC family response regulator